MTCNFSKKNYCRLSIESSDWLVCSGSIEEKKDCPFWKTDTTSLRDAVNEFMKEMKDSRTKDFYCFLLTDLRDWLKENYRSFIQKQEAFNTEDK